MKHKILILFFVVLFLSVAGATFAQQSQSIGIPSLKIDIGSTSNPKDVSTTLQLLLLLTVLSLAPSIMIMMTSYLRLIIVLSFLRQAMGTMTMPPNQLLSGIALFLTFFIMSPTINKVNDNAVKPYMEHKISIDSAYTAGMKPIRGFMLRNVRSKDLELFINFAKLKRPNSPADLPSSILIPAFMISELRAGFVIGFFLFLPFLMIDMIISSILMSMGMMMLPPMLVSLPFKILLFVLVDGWNLIIGSLVRSFS